MANLKRWSDPASLSPDWADRARFAARFVPGGRRILDLGCGSMDVERLFAPSAYRPVDVVARDARTTVLDMNRDAIPASLLADADLVTMLGVIEYIEPIEPHLEAIAASGTVLLASYCAADRLAQVDRRANDWVNDYTGQAFVGLLERSGFEVAQLAVYKGEQLVVLATPKGADVPWLSNHMQPQPLRGRPSPRGRPSLILVGFYGRGNCGDEAILQCVHEAFADAFDIVISVDEHGAFKGFWDWYPYNKSKIIHQTNLAELFVNPTVVGLLVGGGGLPIGFASNQVLAALLGRKVKAIAGIDFWNDAILDEESVARAMQVYLSPFDLVAVRHGASLGYPGAESLPAMHGGDWAFRLQTDTSDDVVVDRTRVLVILRESAIETVPWSYQAEITAVIAAIRARALTPVFLPFCPEDERFLAEKALDRLTSIERCWWNPRRVKQIIASSGMVLSVGRLHPLIFAADVGVPAAAIIPPHLRAQGVKPLEKVTDMAAELGIPVLESMDAVLGFLDAPTAADDARVAAARGRTDEMVEALRTLFHNAAAARTAD